MGRKFIITGYVFGALFAVIGLVGVIYVPDLIHSFVTSVVFKIYYCMTIIRLN